MEAWKENNLKKLMDAVGEVELTDEERKTLEWLSGMEFKSIHNIVSIIRKVRESKITDQH